MISNTKPSSLLLLLGNLFRYFDKRSLCIISQNFIRVILISLSLFLVESNILQFIRKKPQRACPICRAFIKNNFARHVKSCAERAGVCVCSICMTIVDPEAIEVHRMICCQKVYTCETCDSIFTCTKALRNHQSRDHGDSQPNGMLI